MIRWARAVLHSRAVPIVGAVVAVAVPMLTLPRLPAVHVWPVVLGVLPWLVGKYVLCPLRWQLLTGGRLGRWWHLRAYAESELLGLLTPGHVGADLWRLRRLMGQGLDKRDAITSVSLDRLVGALGLAGFVLFAGGSLPIEAPGELVAGALLLAAIATVAVLLVRHRRGQWLPRLGSLPTPRVLVVALLLSLGYQLSIAALLVGTLAGTGHALSPLAILGAFGASQLAGAVPGPNGASPRDGALVVALVALGIPVLAAAAAVALKAALAWLPALLLGGTSLAVAQRA